MCYFLLLLACFNHVIQHNVIGYRNFFLYCAGLDKVILLNLVVILNGAVFGAFRYFFSCQPVCVAALCVNAVVIGCCLRGNVLGNFIVMIVCSIVHGFE